MSKQSEDKKLSYLVQKELQQKLRIKEENDNRMIDELKKKFPKHLYDSAEEESDYEINERDLHPKRD